MKNLKLSGCAESAIEIEILDALENGFYDGDDEESAARLFSISDHSLLVPESTVERNLMVGLLMNRANLHGDQASGRCPAEMSKIDHYRIAVSLGAVADKLRV
jgi:hypothetical protein